MLQRALDWDIFFRTTQATENSRLFWTW